MRLSDSQKTLLAKLKYRDPERYKSKLDAIGLQEKDIQEYIECENDRKKSIDSIKTSVSPEHKASDNNGYTYYRGGKAYWSPTPKIYIMIDGDNNAFRNMEGYDDASKNPDVKIQIFVANEGLSEKYRIRYKINPILVKPGWQAVDTRINKEVKKMVTSKAYNKFYIISKDQGYNTTIDILQNKYHLNQEDITLCEDIKSAIC